MSRSRYCRHAMPRLCPLSVRINSLVTVFQTLIVRSPDADTMYLSSKSTTLTAARWPTRTRRNVMSTADCISQTAIERSCSHHQYLWHNSIYLHLQFTLTADEAMYNKSSQRPHMSTNENTVLNWRTSGYGSQLLPKFNGDFFVQSHICDKIFMKIRSLSLKI